MRARCATSACIRGTRTSRGAWNRGASATCCARRRGASESTDGRAAPEAQRHPAPREGGGHRGRGGEGRGMAHPGARSARSFPARRRLAADRPPRDRGGLGDGRGRVARPDRAAAVTALQVALVQGSWKDILAISETAAQLFYLRLFALDPSLRAMFKGEMREQARKLIAMMSVAVNGLARIETLVPVIEALGRRHAGYGVKDEHYATVAASLLRSEERRVGKEGRSQWTAHHVQKKE